MLGPLLKISTTCTIAMGPAMWLLIQWGTAHRRVVDPTDLHFTSVTRSWASTSKALSNRGRIHSFIHIHPPLCHHPSKGCHYPSKGCHCGDRDSPSIPHLWVSTLIILVVNLPNNLSILMAYDLIWLAPYNLKTFEGTRQLFRGESCQMSLLGFFC
jgi:hypothetical protein